MLEDTNFTVIYLCFLIFVVFAYHLVLEIKSEYFKIILKKKYSNDWKQIIIEIENFIKENYSQIIEYTLTGKKFNQTHYSSQYLYRILGIDFLYSRKEISYITLEEIRVLKFEKIKTSSNEKCILFMMYSYFPFEKIAKPNPEEKIFVHQEWKLTKNESETWKLDSIVTISTIEKFTRPMMILFWITIFLLFLYNVFSKSE